MGVSLSLSSFFCEQIGINGSPFRRAKDLEKVFGSVRICLKNSSDRTLLVDKFELITAITFDYFSAEKPDVVIMGSRHGWLSRQVPMFVSLFWQPSCTIGLDHVVPGPDVASIARKGRGLSRKNVLFARGRIELNSRKSLFKRLIVYPFQ